MRELITSIELANLTLNNSEFEVIAPEEAANGGSYEFSCEVNLIEDEDSKNEFQLSTKFQMRGFREQDDLFILKLNYVGTFEILNGLIFSELPQKTLVHYCIGIIYPTLRESVLFFLAKAGLGGIDIPFHLSVTDAEEIPKN